MKWYKSCVFIICKNFDTMKTLLITVAVLFLVTGLPAQEIKKDTISRKEAKKLKKMKKEAELKASYDSISQVIDSRQFVLEADFLDNLRGHRIYVLSTLNFVAVDTSYGVLQIGSNRGMGYNGVGGVTAEGKITKWKVEKNDAKQTIFIEMSIMTNIGIYDAFLNIDAEGKATAVISGLRPGHLEFDGRIVPLDESTIFKGRTP